MTGLVRYLTILVKSGFVVTHRGEEMKQMLLGIILIAAIAIGTPGWIGTHFESSILRAALPNR